MGQRAARGSRGCGEAGRYEEQAEERALLKGEQARWTGMEGKRRRRSG